MSFALMLAISTMPTIASKWGLPQAHLTSWRYVMRIEEQERQAYMAGDTKTAELLARIDALQRALGQATARIEELENELREIGGFR
jgi:predicted RNase H-like nuclease (RuvC/YqgF family)